MWSSDVSCCQERITLLTDSFMACCRSWTSFPSLGCSLRDTNVRIGSSNEAMVSTFSWLYWSEREERCLYMGDLPGNGAWSRKVKMTLWFQLHLCLWITNNSTVLETRAYNYRTVNQGIIFNDHRNPMLVMMWRSLQFGSSNGSLGFDKFAP
jgi:hypothetical protein